MLLEHASGSISLGTQRWMKPRPRALQYSMEKTAILHWVSNSPSLAWAGRAHCRPRWLNRLCSILT